MNIARITQQIIQQWKTEPEKIYTYLNELILIIQHAEERKISLIDELPNELMRLVDLNNIPSFPSVFFHLMYKKDRTTNPITLLQAVYETDCELFVELLKFPYRNPLNDETHFPFVRLINAQDNQGNTLLHQLILDLYNDYQRENTLNTRKKDCLIYLLDKHTNTLNPFVENKAGFMIVELCEHLNLWPVFIKEEIFSRFIQDHFFIGAQMTLHAVSSTIKLPILAFTQEFHLKATDLPHIKVIKTHDALVSQTMLKEINVISLIHRMQQALPSLVKRNYFHHDIHDFYLSYEYLLAALRFNAKENHSSYDLPYTQLIDDLNHVGIKKRALIDRLSQQLALLEEVKITPVKNTGLLCFFTQKLIFLWNVMCCLILLGSTPFLIVSLIQENKPHDNSLTDNTNKIFLLSLLTFTVSFSFLLWYGLCRMMFSSLDTAPNAQALNLINHEDNAILKNLLTYIHHNPIFLTDRNDKEIEIFLEKDRLSHEEGHEALLFIQTRIKNCLDTINKTELIQQEQQYLPPLLLPEETPQKLKKFYSVLKTEPRISFHGSLNNEHSPPDTIMIEVDDNELERHNPVEFV
jgi:hypothetical protein